MKPIVKGLKEQLPAPNLVMHDDQICRDFTNVQKWWEANHQIWTVQLRKVIIKYRKIGHNWQFCESQKVLLQQYYDANRLLINCLNSDCHISPKVRQEIEETLLLPIAGLKRGNGFFSECSRWIIRSLSIARVGVRSGGMRRR